MIRRNRSFGFQVNRYGMGFDIAWEQVIILSPQQLKGSVAAAHSSVPTATQLDRRS
jgi:hypothetical protein